jgi:hypothetical protein
LAPANCLSGARKLLECFKRKSFFNMKKKVTVHLESDEAKTLKKAADVVFRGATERETRWLAQNAIRAVSEEILRTGKLYAPLRVVFLGAGVGPDYVEVDLSTSNLKPAPRAPQAQGSLGKIIQFADSAA